MKFLCKSSLLAGLGLILLPSAAFADDGTGQDEPGVWRLGAGVNYSEGDYGEPQRTTVVSAPVSLRYRKGGFNFRVSVPFVSIDGPGSLLDTPQGRDAGFGDSSGGDDKGGESSGSGSSGSNSGSSGSGSSGSDGSGSDDGGSTSAGGDVIPVAGASSRRSGIGDVSISLGYSVPIGSTTWFDVTGRVKLPTASTAKRLGTGKVDVTVGGDLVQDIGDLSLYAGGRYRFLGKPAGSTLRDTWGAGAGASYRLPGGAYVGADYGWQESATPGRGASSEMTGWVNFAVSKRLRMQVFASTGFNANSADFAGGLSLSYRLN